MDFPQRTSGRVKLRGGCKRQGRLGDSKDWRPLKDSACSPRIPKGGKPTLFGGDATGHINLCPIPHADSTSSSPRDPRVSGESAPAGIYTSLGRPGANGIASRRGKKTLTPPAERKDTSNPSHFTFYPRLSCRPGNLGMFARSWDLLRSRMLYLEGCYDEGTALVWREGIQSMLIIIFTFVQWFM